MFSLRQFGYYGDFYEIDVEKMDDDFKEVELLIFEINGKVLS
jgi:hypothetical protein